MERQEIGQLVKSLRKERGLTQGQLARYARVGRSWLSVLEMGKIERPDVDKLKKLASVLRVHPDILLAAAGYEAVPIPIRRHTPQELLRELEAITPILVPETRQPVSAGIGAEVEIEYWPYWPEMRERGHRFIAVPVSGNCMEPRIREGERVIVDTDASPRPGDVVVAIHEGEALVKMLTEENGKLILMALRDQPPIRVTGETKILGVVRMAMHRP